MTEDVVTAVMCRQLGMAGGGGEGLSDRENTYLSGNRAFNCLSVLDKSFFFFFFLLGSTWSELDGVGPVDNRPSTDNLHHFVKKKGHVTCDT